MIFVPAALEARHAILPQPLRLCYSGRSTHGAFSLRNARSILFLHAPLCISLNVRGKALPAWTLARFRSCSRGLARGNKEAKVCMAYNFPLLDRSLARLPIDLGLFAGQICGCGCGGRSSSCGVADKPRFIKFQLTLSPTFFGVVVERVDGGGGRAIFAESDYFPRPPHRQRSIIIQWGGKLQIRAGPIKISFASALMTLRPTTWTESGNGMLPTGTTITSSERTNDRPTDRKAHKFAVRAEEQESSGSMTKRTRVLFLQPTSPMRSQSPCLSQQWRDII